MGMKTEAAVQATKSRPNCCFHFCLISLVLLILLTGAAIAALIVNNFFNNGKSDVANETMFTESDGFKLKFKEDGQDFCLWCNVFVDTEAVYCNATERKWWEDWEAPEEIRKRLPHRFLGFDKNNRPVWLAEYGKWDVAWILENEENFEILDKIGQQSIHRIRQTMLMRSTPENPVTGWVLIADMDEYAWSQLSLNVVKFMQEMATKYQFFLKSIDYGFIIKMNAFARFVVEAMRPFVGNVLEKIETHGYDEDQWLPLILEKIPQHQLPYAYGGFKNFTALAEYR